MLYISPVFVMPILAVGALLLTRDENGALHLSLTTIILILLSNILTGFYEESLFRSLLTQNLLLNLSKFSLFKTVFFSSLAFSLIHALQSGPLQMVNAMFGGIFAAAVFIRTKNIWPVVIEHAIWDISVFLFNTEGAKGSLNGAIMELATTAPNSLPVVFGGIYILLSYLLGIVFGIIGLFLLRKSKHAEIKELWGIS